MGTLSFRATGLASWNTRKSALSADFSPGTHLYRDGLGSNQACTLFGAQGGSNIISGTSYISAGYGLDPKDLWRRDLPVLLGFFLLFQLTQIFALEFYPVRFLAIICSVYVAHDYLSNMALTYLSTSSQKRQRKPGSWTPLFVKRSMSKGRLTKKKSSCEMPRS